MSIRLLIVTQKVDENDAVLGFFHGWLIEFAKQCASIIVICLEEGVHHLPGNVKVLSLGKEKKQSRLQYVARFYRYVWQERGEYDMVFAHMNQEYVILGGLVWKMLGKGITMWRNHAKGTIMTRIAVFLSDMVFCTSPQSFTARFKKTKFMPVGINTNFFKQDSSVRRKRNSILFLGRIAPVKNVDVFIEALKELQTMGVEFYATIAGGSSDKDEEYEKMIHKKVEAYGLGDRVMFLGVVSQTEAAALYREHELYVNITPSGSLDKTIIEALASGSVVLVSNSFFHGKIPESWIVEDAVSAQALAHAMKNALSEAHGYDMNARNDVMDLIEKNSLKNLIEELMDVMLNADFRKK